MIKTTKYGYLNVLYGFACFKKMEKSIRTGTF